MGDGFDKMIGDAQGFLKELAAQNDRDWFNAEKDRYAARLKAPAEHLLAALERPLSEMAGTEVATKLFRPQRDVRFSKDKTPYHTHLHMAWMVPDGPGWFFGIAPDYVSAGCGMMGFDKDRLTRFRAAVDGPAGADLAGVLDARMDAPELKRVPAPYDKKHPRGSLLRRKSLAVWRDGLEERLKGDVPGALAAVFAEFQPVMVWLQDHV